MLPTNVNSGRSGLAHAAFLWVISWTAAPLSAQELPLERDYPGPGPYQCPAPSAYPPPTPDGQVQAAQLASDAVQAVILGELLRAQELLARATELDPSSAELAYRHGRVLEDLTGYDQAISEYCRALSLGSREAGILDARERLDSAYEIVRERIPPAALEAFVAGLEAADLGLHEAAVGSFTVAMAQAPTWAEAVYNRAVVLEAMGRVSESLADYRRFLQLTPMEVDPVVMRASERIGLLEGMVTLPTPSPTGALALGVAFPGMGHYYSGRGLTGTIVLATAAGAVAAGVLVKEVTVRCLNAAPGGSCPPGDVVEESTSRPYLIPAIGAAAAVTVIAAFEAFVRARGRRAEAEAEGVDTIAGRFGGVRIPSPAVAARRGRIDVRLFTFRFR
jgi:tetratricopeptide (TPR) repeat protein